MGRSPSELFPWKLLHASILLRWPLDVASFILIISRFRALVFAPEFVGNARLVNPYSEHRGEIFIRGGLKRRADVWISDGLSAQKSDHLCETSTNGLLSVGVFECDEKQRRLRQSDSTLFDRILHGGRDERLFDRFF